MKRAKLVVVGSSNTDMVVQVPSIPARGETVLGDELRMVAGGKGANQAVAAARLGAEVCFIGCVGQDNFGDQTVANLAKEGIETRYIVRDPDHPSGVALIAVMPRGENAIVVAPGANAYLRPEHVERAEVVIAQADSVIAQLEIPLETVEAAARLAKKHGVSFILNPAPARPLRPELLRLAEVLTPNESEALQLTGIPDYVDMSTVLRTLCDWGCRHVVITLGARGVLCCSEGEIRAFPALRVPAVDSTAAGDAFVAGLAVALAEGESFLQAVQFAQRVAALAVTRWGAQPSLPTRQEVENFPYDHPEEEVNP